MTTVPIWIPRTWYWPSVYPYTRDTLDTTNEAAHEDERTGWARKYALDPDGFDYWTKEFEAIIKSAINHGHHVISFDIDYTLDIGIDRDLRDLIPIKTITELQRAGCIVGTCSDRDASRQREVMGAFYQHPYFCIPKELLGWVGKALPADLHLHVGDDDQRDRDIAIDAGWEFLYPGEFKKEIVWATQR